ncbi:EEV glycoprotein (1), partial [Monkeypox virus]|jgi:hypothetical protein
MMT